MNQRSYYVYILASASAVLYIGMIGALVSRLAKHRERKVPGFTARYDVTRLVYYEVFGSAGAAIAARSSLRVGRA